MATSNQSHERAKSNYERAESWDGIVWMHCVTGLEVEAMRISRPTQMSDPLTASEDEFWRLVARHGDDAETLEERIPVGDRGREQSGKATIVERAREWILSHPSGTLEDNR